MGSQGGVVYFPKTDLGTRLRAASATESVTMTALTTVTTSHKSMVSESFMMNSPSVILFLGST